MPTAVARVILAGEVAAVLHTVSVFIASPGDVEKERDATRYAVERVNRLVAKPNGVLLEAIGWEDLPAGKAERAQTLINPAVDKADIVVGLLSRRFGTPNGVAESGTQEEYQRAVERRKNENPGPDIKLYFRKLKLSELDAPDEQLQKVLAFKKEVGPTDLYHEFSSVNDLGKRIEDDLAAWVWDRVQTQTLPPVSGIHGIDEADVDVLATLLHGPAGINHERVDKLVGAGLVKPSGKGQVLANSMEGFVAIARHLNVAAHQRELLESRYFSEMMRVHLKGVLLARYHAPLDNADVEVLRQMAILSPRVTSYLLTGDTTLYDNLAAHAQKIGQHDYAMKMLCRNMLHQSLVAYATDAINGNVLHAVDGRPLDGQFVGIRLRAVFEDDGVLDATSIVPGIRAKNAGPDDADKGQIMSATSPQFFIRSGTIFSKLGLPDQAIEAFNAALGGQLSDEDRAAALNNLGLTLINAGKREDARPYLLEAASLNPASADIKNNVELLGPAPSA